MTSSSMESKMRTAQAISKSHAAAVNVVEAVESYLGELDYIERCVRDGGSVEDLGAAVDTALGTIDEYQKNRSDYLDDYLLADSWFTKSRLYIARPGRERLMVGR